MTAINIYQGKTNLSSLAADEARAFAVRYSRHVTRARARHAVGVEAVESFERWQAAVATLLLAGAKPEKARDEYFAQTAYPPIRPRIAAARATTVRARFTTGTSIIAPSNCTAPNPFA